MLFTIGIDYVRVESASRTKNDRVMILKLGNSVKLWYRTENREAEKAADTANGVINNDEVCLT
jgi:hypothetical protein